MKPSPYDLMQMHVQALYVHDQDSRLLTINDGSDKIAPRFFLGRTRQGNVWRFRQDLPQALCSKLESLCEAETAASERPQYEAAYIRMLAAHSPIKQIWLGPAYLFPHRLEAASEAIQINEQNSHLLKNGLQDWLPDVATQQPFVARVVNGQAVAVCASVRITAVAHEAGVETLAAHRRRGYALSVVSAWANEVRQIGAVPLYSTSIENKASQQVAARLGLIKYGLDFHIT